MAKFFYQARKGPQELKQGSIEAQTESAAITSVGYAIHAEVADSIANVSVVPQVAIVLWKGDSCPVELPLWTANSSSVG